MGLSAVSAVRGFSVWLGETVNDWFGDRPFEEGGKVTNGRLGLRNLWRQDEGWNTNVRFRARFDLPNLRDKAYVESVERWFARRTPTRPVKRSPSNFFLNDCSITLNKF